VSCEHHSVYVMLIKSVTVRDGQKLSNFYRFENCFFVLCLLWNFTYYLLD